MSEKDLRTALADYDNILGFEDVGEAVKVTMEYQRGAKGKETWAKVNGILKEYGGEWKSQGRESHWTVPKTVHFKQPAEFKQALTLKQLLDRAEQLENQFHSFVAELSACVFYGKEETKKGA